MKTLKRTLCLVLALVLAISTMAVVTAKFDDESEITTEYAEAVEVMAALGILEGRTETDFVPAGTLTRAEAAKLVAFVRFGDSAAALEDGGVCRFEDVEDGSWASAWIELMAEYGAICGVSDTKFAPAAKLTGYQWAKLLLVALGYGQGANVNSDEYFEGLGWEVRVKRYADMAGLLNFMADDFDLQGAIRRDEAAQMAFAAMLVSYKSETVKNFVSDGNGGYIVVNVSDVIDTLGEYNYGLYYDEGVVESKTMYTALADSESTAALYNTLVNGSKMDLTETAKNYDLCARHAEAWFVKNAKGEYVQLTALNYLDTFTKVNDVAALKALKTDKDNVGTLVLFENGAVIGEFTIAQLTTDTMAAAIFESNNYNAPVAYDYDSDGYVDALICEQWNVAQVTAVSDADDNGVVTYTFTCIDTDKYDPKGGLELNRVWTVEGAANAYAEGAFYTVVPNAMFDQTKDADSELTAANVFLRPVVALSTKTGTVSDVVKTYSQKTAGSVGRESWNGISDITFKTSFGDVKWSAGNYYNFYYGKLSEKFDLDNDDTRMNFYDTFNFKFYFDKNGEVVAYEIVEETEFVGYINDFYFIYGDTTSTGHNATKTAYTVYAHIVDLDGKVMSIPVSTASQDNSKIYIYDFRGMGAERLPSIKDQPIINLNNNLFRDIVGISCTEAENTVRDMNARLSNAGEMNKDARIAKFVLTTAGVYAFFPYEYAKLVDIDPSEADMGKCVESCFAEQSVYDYNFTADTKIYNVSEEVDVLTATKMDAAVADENVWIVLSAEADGSKGAFNTYDYTVLNIFYDTYVPGYEPITAFVPTNFVYTAKTSDRYGVVYSFTAYVDGVATTLNVKAGAYGDLDTIKAMQTGGFYTFEYDAASGLYYGANLVYGKMATVTDKFEGNNTFDYSEVYYYDVWGWTIYEKDYSASNITIINAQTGKTVALKDLAVGTKITTVYGIADSTVGYINNYGA